MVVIQYEDEEVEKINEIREDIPKIESKFNIQIELIIIDAGHQESASKAKEDDSGDI